MKKAIITIVIFTAFLISSDILSSVIFDDKAFSQSISWLSIISAFVTSILIFFIGKLIGLAFKSQDKKISNS